MPIRLHNLIIFGDSLSDIGRKRDTPVGMFARAIGAMRTNAVGRYSDGRNWTDFLAEWAGADPLVRFNAKTTEAATEDHRCLTENSLLLGTDVGGGLPLRYANYAEGGAVAASDWSPKAGALGYLKTQVNTYIKQRRKLGDRFSGDTMHIVWIGLNDIVTAERPEGLVVAPSGKDVHKTNVKGETDGKGFTPIVAEIKDLVNSIGSAFPGSRDHDHYMLVDLPSPTVAVRFTDQIADGKSAEVEQYKKHTLRFNELLENVTANWPPDKDGPGAKRANISLVRMSKWLMHVTNNTEAYELTKAAQYPGVPVPYYGMPDTVQRAVRRCLTTSDLAHPTEAVYELIAAKIADDLVTKYTLGNLDQTSWPANRPYPHVRST